MNHAPSDSETAQALAHELFAHECFAFTGDGPKPHSRRCQEAAQRLEEWRGSTQEAQLSREHIIRVVLQAYGFTDHTLDDLTWLRNTHAYAVASRVADALTD